MTELEQQLMQSLERLQCDYELQFKDLHEHVNSLANSMSEKQKKPISSTLAKQECEKICLECKHGKYSKYSKLVVSTEEKLWRFSCLIDHSQKRSVVDCTHYEPTLDPNMSILE